MIEVDKSKLDARHNIYYPVEALLSSSSSPQKNLNTKLEKKKVFSNFLQDGKLHLPDISLYPTKESIKSEILGAIERWKKDGFLVKLYDGFEVEVKYEEDPSELDTLLIPTLVNTRQKSALLSIGTTLILLILKRAKTEIIHKLKKKKMQNL